jgi:hypothetical protein
MRVISTSFSIFAAATVLCVSTSTSFVRAAIPEDQQDSESFVGRKDDNMEGLPDASSVSVRRQGQEELNDGKQNNRKLEDWWLAAFDEPEPEPEPEPAWWRSDAMTTRNGEFSWVFCCVVSCLCLRT